MFLPKHCERSTLLQKQVAFYSWMTEAPRPRWVWASGALLGVRQKVAFWLSVCVDFEAPSESEQRVY